MGGRDPPPSIGSTHRAGRLVRHPVPQGGAIESLSDFLVACADAAYLGLGLQLAKLLHGSLNGREAAATGKDERAALLSYKPHRELENRGSTREVQHGALLIFRVTPFSNEASRHKRRKGRRGEGVL